MDGEPRQVDPTTEFWGHETRWRDPTGIFPMYIEAISHENKEKFLTELETGI